MVNLKERTRKVDLESMTEEQIEAIEKQLGEKFREIIDRACEEANKVSKPYGFEVKLQFAAVPLDQPPSKE